MAEQPTTEQRREAMARARQKLRVLYMLFKGHPEDEGWLGWMTRLDLLFIRLDAVGLARQLEYETERSTADYDAIRASARQDELHYIILMRMCNWTICRDSMVRAARNARFEHHRWNEWCVHIVANPTLGISRAAFQEACRMRALWASFRRVLEARVRIWERRIAMGEQHAPAGEQRGNKRPADESNADGKRVRGPDGGSV